MHLNQRAASAAAVCSVQGALAAALGREREFDWWKVGHHCICDEVKLSKVDLEIVACSQKREESVTLILQPITDITVIHSSFPTGMILRPLETI